VLQYHFVTELTSMVVVQDNVDTTVEERKDGRDDDQSSSSVSNGQATLGSAFSGGRFSANRPSSVGGAGVENANTHTQTVQVAV
jgi:hypothetical protein